MIQSNGAPRKVSTRSQKRYNIRIKSALYESNFKGGANLLTFFGSIAVTIMMLSYWLEPRSKWFVLLFAAGCSATSAYSALVQAYPITVIEAIWALVAMRRFSSRYRQERA